MTTTGENWWNASTVNWLVNSDHDPDNYAVLMFDDFYNITKAEVKMDVMMSNQHAYFYVSQYNDTDWTLIWDGTGMQAFDWHGDSQNLDFIRYAKITTTGFSTSTIHIDAVRLTGIVGESGNIVYPDHVEYSIGVVNASHTLDNNETYATMDFDAVIIWDFGSIIENVTAIRWELIHIVTGGSFKLDASIDYVIWNVVSQHQESQTLPAPPTTRNDSTRYDSEIHGRFRYLKMLAINLVLNDWFMDYICVIVQPPAITYELIPIESL